MALEQGYPSKACTDKACRTAVGPYRLYESERPGFAEWDGEKWIEHRPFPRVDPANADPIEGRWTAKVRRDRLRMFTEAIIGAVILLAIIWFGGIYARERIAEQERMNHVTNPR